MKKNSAQVLCLVAGAWLTILLITLLTHSRTVARLMPLLTILLVVVALVVTILLILRPNEQPPPTTNPEAPKAESTQSNAQNN